MTKPNFIVFLTDDQGYGDLSCMGAEDFCTPHLDRMAESGVRFTDWYSNSPVCSPSRASLLTGRYPGNAGVRSILAGHRTATGLLPEVPSLAIALKDQGYQTAMFGKWHLGLADGCRPEDHGFDEWFGFLAGCIDYYSHVFYWGMAGGNDPTHDLWENGEEIYLNGQYFTDMITQRAVEYIRHAASSEKPFFLYLPHNAPHYPMHAPKEYIDRFPHLSPDRRIMAAMISAVDDCVGAVTAELERQGILNNTCMFFTSDNGPSRETRNWFDGTKDPYYGGTSGKLKGHKFSLYDGGIRMPAVMSWPERIPEGQVISEMAASMDIFPTLVKAAGGDPDEYQLDGIDIMPMAADGQPTPHKEIYWEMNKQTAVRRGKWKLVLNGQLVEGAPPEDDIHLSDIEIDMGEKQNLKDEFPDITKDLMESAESWRNGIEKCWKDYWMPRIKGTTTHPEKK
ncbi:sulfatase-like hydrolase/transferase [Candidatus Poribacteria bacterium]|nr:sulfatase-like hydrolase/transferase [Candidatus Poribacteria bacterium]